MSTRDELPAVMVSLVDQVTLLTEMVAVLQLEKTRMQGAARGLLTDAGIDPGTPLIDGIRQLWAQREGLARQLDELEKQHARERLEWAAIREQLRTDLRLAVGGARTVEGRYGDAG